MAEQVFERRGVGVRLETTEIAELDAALFSVSDDDLDKIGRHLKAIAVSEADEVRGMVRIRAFEDLDLEVLFITTRLEGEVMIKIVGLMRPSEGNRAAEILQKVGTIAVLRGASGIRCDDDTGRLQGPDTGGAHGNAASGGCSDRGGGGC